MVKPVISTRYENFKFELEKIQRILTLRHVRSIWFKLWWKFCIGTEIKVRWPNGYTEPDHLGNSTESSDPNDHYRPWMEKNIGKQGWDWNWHLCDDDIKTNRLTIKIRKKKEKFSSIISLKWN